MRSGNDLVLRSVQSLDTLHADGRRARALDLRAHLREHVGDIHHLGLASRVLNHCLAIASTAAMRISSVPVTVMRSK